MNNALYKSTMFLVLLCNERVNMISNTFIHSNAVADSEGCMIEKFVP